MSSSLLLAVNEFLYDHMTLRLVPDDLVGFVTSAHFSLRWSTTHSEGHLKASTSITSSLGLCCWQEAGMKKRPSVSNWLACAAVVTTTMRRQQFSRERFLFVCFGTPGVYVVLGVLCQLSQRYLWPFITFCFGVAYVLIKHYPHITMYCI